MMLNLDKSTWQRVKFGDVVKNINDYFSPETDGVLPYVAGPHIDPESMRVRAYGKTSDDNFPPTFKRKFQPGDVLLHSRGIEKIAATDCQGVTGEKLFVLRAIDSDLLDQRFLPILLRSPLAAEYLVNHFTGSVNRFLNWKPLAAWEFDLPPLDQQKRIADLMWSLQRHRTATSVNTDATLAARATYAASKVSVMLDEASADFSTIWSRSPESGWSQKPVDTRTGHFVLSLAALDDIGYVRGRLKSVELSDKVAATRLKPGDTLISRANTHSLVGRCGIFNESRGDVSFPDTMMRLHFTDDVIPAFAVEVINSLHGRTYMRKVAAGSATSMVKINRQSLGRLPFPRVTLERQSDFLKDLAYFDSALDTLRSQNETLRNTERGLQELALGAR